MDVPDLVGLKLEDALQKLEENGLYIVPKIVRYLPPASKGLKLDCDLEERVIRQRPAGDGQVELVVSYFRYRPLDFESCKPTCEEEG